jgi:Transposase DDE domain
MARRRSAEIDLLRVVDLLHEHLTAPLCHAAFKRVRRTERQRAWTLNALVQFWTAVILRAPAALSQALTDSLEGRETMFPRIQASPEAFFQRCRDLRPAFFIEVFERFTARLADAVPPRYAPDLAPLYARFAAVVVLDGSRLAAIARRLKLLWAERAVVLPGALLGVYDLGRGLCRALHFDPDAAASEFTRARPAVTTLPRNTLVVGDRLYATAAFFDLVRAQRCWAVVRRQRALSLQKLERLRKRRFLGGDLEDWLVRAGSGHTAPAQTLRHIRWRRDGLRYEVWTNVLSPVQLAAEEALALYPFRWTIERMFFDLKEVLNLNRLYAANPNAVAMQVYAAAIVYNAFRVAQSDAAAQLGEPPEDLSPAKLFPKIAVASFLYLHAQEWERQWRRRHPGAHAHLVVRWRTHGWTHTAASNTHVEHRSEIRRRRRFCAARRHWKSFRLVRGGRRFLAKLS